jgi:hypothetical protein
MPSSKLLCRATLRIRNAMQFRSQEVPGVEQPILKCLAERQRAMMRSGQRLRKARAHCLTLIVPQLQQELLARADDVNYSLGQLRSLLEGSAPPVASAADLHAELRQLQDEFGNLSITWKDKVVSVTTERIVLEDFDLGPFARTAPMPASTSGTASSATTVAVPSPVTTSPTAKAATSASAPSA